MKNTFYWFTFADGYRVCTRGFSKHELRVEESKHGKLILEDTSGRLKYFFSAMNAGMDVKTFTQMYSEYYSIDQSEKDTGEKAADWAYALERARETRQITEAQRDVLKKEMVFYQMFPAGTDKFDQMVENGISADDAKDLGWLLNGIEPQAGYTDVRPAQKFEAIAGSELSEADKIAVLKIYGNDSQDENLDQMLSMGFTAADYAAAYRMYSDASGEGKKQRTIAAYMARFGVDRNTAKAIYEIYG